MIKYFQNRFALSEKGAKDLRRGIAFSTLLNLALMLPPSYLFLFLMEYLEADSRIGQHTLWFYVLLAVVLMCVMFFISRWQYDSTYTTIYNESAQRRIGLAEKLRRLPLAFFGERNLSDLTSTIMEDCTSLEQIFSHAVPQLFASVLSMLIIAVSLFFYDWRLAVALFWVVPMALGTLLLARRMMDKSFERNYHIKRSVTEQVQEGLECVQEIKSYNGEAEYNQRFDSKLKAYEKELINGELVAGSFVNLSAMLLKLGMPTVIVAGAWLLQRGDISIFVYLAFLLISAMVYNPIQEVCNNLAILTFLDVRINRMKEMEAMPEQEGSKEVKMDNYDIEFRNVSFAYETEKQVLHNVSFTAKQGEVTALVGPSGGGKSTTAKLAARFWDIDGGKILLGGNDIAHIDPETLLRNYAVVFQDVLLFNASVSDNIRIGKRDATDEEVRRVHNCTVRRLHQPYAAGIRHRYRRERRNSFRWRAAAYLHCPCASERRLPSFSWTKPPPALMPRTRQRFRRASPNWCRVRPSSLSLTACAPSAMPTTSWCSVAERLSSRARPKTSWLKVENLHGW